MNYSYYVSYYYRNSFFKRGFGWIQLMHSKRLLEGKDIHEIQSLVKKYTGFKGVSVINFKLLDERHGVDTEQPWWSTGNGA